jgi:hypothetical protein
MLLYLGLLFGPTSGGVLPKRRNFTGPHCVTAPKLVFSIGVIKT